MFSSKLQVPMSKVVMLNIKLLRRVGVCYQIDQGETPWIHSPSQDSIQVRARHRQGFISLNLLYNCFKKGAALSLTKTSAPRIFQAAVLASYMLKYYLSVCLSIYLSVCLSIYLSVCLSPALPRAECCVTCQIQGNCLYPAGCSRHRAWSYPGSRESSTASGTLTGRGFSLVLALISE